MFLVQLGSLGEGKDPQSSLFCNGKRKPLTEGPRWLPPDSTLRSSATVCFNCITFIFSKEQFEGWQVGICKRLKEKENCFPAVNLCLCLFYVSEKQSVGLFM